MFLSRGDIMPPYQTAYLATKLTSSMSLFKQLRVNESLCRLTLHGFEFWVLSLQFWMFWFELSVLVAYVRNRELLLEFHLGTERIVESVSQVLRWSENKQHGYLNNDCRRFIPTKFTFRRSRGSQNDRYFREALQTCILFTTEAGLWSMAFVNKWSTQGWIVHGGQCNVAPTSIATGRPQSR